MCCFLWAAKGFRGYFLTLWISDITFLIFAEYFWIAFILEGKKNPTNNNNKSKTEAVTLFFLPIRLQGYQYQKLLNYTCCHTVLLFSVKPVPPVYHIILLQTAYGKITGSLGNPTTHCSSITILPQYKTVNEKKWAIHSLFRISQPQTVHFSNAIASLWGYIVFTGGENLCVCLTSKPDLPVSLQAKPLLITPQVWLHKNQHQDVKSRNLTPH